MKFQAIRYYSSSDILEEFERVLHDAIEKGWVPDDEYTASAREYVSELIARRERHFEPRATGSQPTGDFAPGG